jgi:selenide,water dikinase
MEVMATLNKGACEAMVEVGVHSATDVTGFGVLGHACGMADGAGVTLRIRVRDLPKIEGLDVARMKKYVCGGLKRNLTWGDSHVRWAPGLTDEDRALVADPQTSGGLLIAVPADRLDRLLAALKARGVTTRAVVGDVIARTDVSLDVV